MSELDTKLSLRYDIAVSCSPSPSALREQQREWLHNVRNKCKDTECLTSAYRERSARFEMAATREERLIDASFRGDEALIEQLLKQGVNVNYRTEHGNTPLFSAVNMNHAAAVRALLKAQADPNLDAGANSPLTRAIGRDTEIVRSLLAAGANVNFEDGQGGSPLFAAVGLTEANFEYLRAKGSYVGPSPNPAETVKLLIAAGADVNHTGKGHDTPLQIAIEKNNTDAVRLLLNAGANPNAYYRTPELRYYGSGEDPSLVVGLGLHLYTKGSTEILDLLLAHGADPNYRSYRPFRDESSFDGQTPLTYMASKGDYAVAKLLLERGADPCLRREDGARAAVVAAKNGHRKVAALIKGAEQGRCGA